MSKKTIFLLGILVITLLTGFFLYRKNNQTETNVSSSRDFKVSDINSVGKIFVTDKNNSKLEITKKGDKWIYDRKYTADKQFMEYLLQTIQKIEVKNLVPKPAISAVMKDIAVKGIKVELYDNNNRKIKDYYIGSESQIGYANYMVLDGYNIPYAVGIPNFDGSIRERYWPLFKDDIISRKILQYAPNTIDYVSMEYPRNRNESFTLRVLPGQNYDITPIHSTTKVIQKQVKRTEVEAFLIALEDLQAAQVFTKDKLPTDTLISDIPFAKLKIVAKTHDTTQLIIYPVIMNEDERKGISLQHKPFSYFINKDNNLFYSGQLRPLEKIFFGYSFFY